MSEEIISQHEQSNRNKARLGAALGLVLIMLILVMPFFSFQDPPPGQEGILVNLGIPEQGMGDDENSGPAETFEEEIEESEPDPQPEEVEEVEESEPEPQPEPEEVVTSEDPEQVRLEQERKEEERKKREAAEAKRKAEEEAKRKAEAEAKRKQDLKDQYGGLFGKGKGKGETDKEGTQGIEEGDPDADKVKGITSGPGTVSGGLGGRGVARAPKIEDKSQKTGTVVVRVCVDASGRVIEARFTQKGDKTASTSSDDDLVDKAVANAKTWKFQPTNVDKQCGYITYRFRVQ